MGERRRTVNLVLEELLVLSALFAEIPSSARAVAGRRQRVPHTHSEGGGRLSAAEVFELRLAFPGAQSGDESGFGHGRGRTD